MSKKYAAAKYSFPGFERMYNKNFFTYPNILATYWQQLSGSEQKVLDFILRQTMGFRKVSDRIALSQFVDGIGGKSNNLGTGLSISQVRRAIASLEEQGFIRVVRVKNRPSTFYLVIDTSEEMQFDPKAFDVFKKLK